MAEKIIIIIKPWAAPFEIYRGRFCHTQRTHRKRAGKKNPSINPGQPVGKGREKYFFKKTLVLSLGSPPEKAKKKKKKPWY